MLSIELFQKWLNEFPSHSKTNSDENNNTLKNSKFYHQ